MRLTIAVLIPALFLAVPASGAGITLNEAIDTALKNNPAVKAGAWSVKAAGEEAGVAGSYYLPSLSLEDRYMSTDNPAYAFMAKLNQQRLTPADLSIDSLNSPAAVNDYQGTVTLRQTLFSRKASTGIRMARGERAARTEDQEWLKDRIEKEVVSAYLAVVTSDRYVSAAQQAVDDAEEHVRLADLRSKAELGLYSDTLRAQAAEKDAQRRLAGAVKGREVAGRALGLVLGGDRSVEAAGFDCDTALQSIDAYYSGVDRRSDIRALEARLANSGEGVALAKSAAWPELGLTGQYQWNDHSSPVGGEGSGYLAGVFLSWDIFDGAGREHRVRKAQAQVEEMRQNLDGLKKQARFKVFAAYQDVLEAQKALALAEAEYKAAQEGGRLVELRYRNSLSPVVDLLDAQAMLDAARVKVAQAGNDLTDKFFNLGFESGLIDEFLKGVKDRNQGE